MGSITNPSAVRRLAVVTAVAASVFAGGLGLADSATAITPTISEFSGMTASGNPFAITAGPDGNMWFLEYSNPGRVGKITMSGTITEVATGGVTPGFPANSQPSGIVAGPDGDIWFTEGRNPGGIAKIDPATGAFSQVATGGVTAGFTVNRSPQGIVVGPDGSLWFGECNPPGAIGRITPAGVVSEYSSGLTANSCPDELAVGSDGNLWFTEATTPARIGRINPTTHVINEFSAGLTPTANLWGITAAPDGNVWFTESGSPGKIGKITAAGTITEVATGGVTAGFTANSNPTGLVTGPDGELWFDEASDPIGPGRVARLDPATGGVDEFPLPTSDSGPDALAVGPDGNLWSTEGAASKLARITTPPTAYSTGAMPTGATSATVSGLANGHAQPTSFHVEYGALGGATTNTPERSLGTTSGVTSVSASLNGLNPSTTYQARIVVTNPTGSTAGAFLSFTTAPQPAISALRISPSRFSLDGRKLHGRCVAATKRTRHHTHCRRPIRLHVSYALNAGSSLTVALKREAPGRIASGRCVTPTKKNRRHRRCSRVVGVPGTLTLNGTAGANTFTFTGRIGGHVLGPGTYQLIATPIGGSPSEVTFVLAPPTK